jgi:hypothetical protein
MPTDTPFTEIIVRMGGNFSDVTPAAHEDGYPWQTITCTLNRPVAITYGEGGRCSTLIRVVVYTIHADGRVQTTLLPHVGNATGGINPDAVQSATWTREG